MQTKRGLRDIQNFNLALLAKWKWRLISEEKGRWKEMLVSKYGLGSEVSQTPVRLQSWWWRDLSKACGEGGDEGWVQNEVGWKVGCGDKVRFWEDVWTGNSSLKNMFPRLFSLSLNQGHKVEEAGRWDDVIWRWNLRWRRARFEWESLLEAELVIHMFLPVDSVAGRLLQASSDFVCLVVELVLSLMFGCCSC